jgi:hypothetical protein
MAQVKIPCTCHETSPPASLRLEDALGCPDAERVLESMRTGDWGWVDRLPEPLESGLPICGRAA